MDDRFRALERAYLAEPSGDRLVSLLTEYARMGRVPEGDIAALVLVNSDVSDWHLSFNQNLIADLMQMGYPVGVYFNMQLSVRTDLPTRNGFPTVERIAETLAEMIKDSAGRIATILRHGHRPIADFLDSYTLSPSNSEARQRMPDGRQSYQHDIEVVSAALQDIPKDLAATIAKYSAIIKPLAVNKKNIGTATFRIFIPATEIDRICWLTTITRRGISRATVREHATSTIDLGTANQVRKAKASLFGDINQWILNLPSTLTEGVAPTVKLTQFGTNLLGALSGWWRFRKSWLD